MLRAWHRGRASVANAGAHSQGRLGAGVGQLALDLLLQGSPVVAVPGAFGSGPLAQNAQELLSRDQAFLQRGIERRALPKRFPQRPCDPAQLADYLGIHAAVCLPWGPGPRRGAGRGVAAAPVPLVTT